MEKEDILEGLDDILGAAQPAAAPVATKRTRRTKAEMAAAAQTAGGADFADTKPAAPIDPMAAQHGFSGRKRKIIIDKGHGKDDPTTVFLRLNNYEATAARGVPIELYEEVIAACLDCAVQTVFSQPTEGELVPHDALRFSYREVR